MSMVCRVDILSSGSKSLCGIFVLEIETKLMICEQHAIPKSELSLSAALCLKKRLSSAWLNISDKENIT